MEKYTKLQKDDFPVIIGLHENEAFSRLAQKKMTFRLFIRNGQKFMMPPDHRSCRYNLIIVNSIVDSYFFK